MPIDSGVSVKSVVTGGLGFIGHHLVRALTERGDTVLVLDNQVEGVFTERFLQGKVEYVTIDVADVGNKNKKRLVEYCEGANYIFHLAALPRVQFSIENPVETAQANVIGTVAMLNAAFATGAEKFVFASSSSVYGDPEALPLREDMLPMPMSPYARHKLQGEEYCRDFALAPYNLPTVCLRFFNVYGPGADPNGAYALVVAKFLEQKRNGQRLTITDDGEQTRDFTHVRDVVRAIILAAESDQVSMGEVTNVGGGRQISVNEVADLIDPGGDREYIEPRLEPRHTLADIRKAKLLLGWQPEVRFEDGIVELLELYQIKKRPSA